MAAAFRRVKGKFVTPLTNDLVAALLTPAATSTCYGTAETVSVSIRNAGTATLNFAANAATVTVVVTTPGGTQTLTTTLTTGTLAAGATQAVTLPGTLNLSAVGTYSFAITATVQGDGNTGNDLLTPAPTRTVAAPVAGTLSPASATICQSGTATLTLAGAANGSLQFQSSPDGTTFTDIAGATSAPYTTPVLTTTTCYRAQVRCNTNGATSNVSTITVNNPQVAGISAPQTICAGSTATLTATASAGSSVRFFSATTGGTALATAGTYTTPALTASTTYYAEAFAGGTTSVGPLTNAIGTGTQSSASQYLAFDVAQATTLLGVNVYPGAAGNVIVEYRSSTSTVLQSATVAVAASQVGVRTFIPLRFSLVAGAAQRLGLNTSSVSAYRNDSGAAYPYSGGAVSITGNSFDPAYYYWFYDWSVSGECVNGTRTAVQVNVTQLATASFPSAAASTCATSAYQLAGAVGDSATTGTYTSSGTGTFASNATTLNATYTPSAADVNAGSVTITLTAPAAGGCPAAPATLALTVNAAPATPTLTLTLTGGTLTSSAATGNQFYRNNVLIPGATGQRYIVLSGAGNGSYTVTVTNTAGCSATLAPVAVTVTGTTTARNTQLTRYPNPTPDGQVTLELTGYRLATELTVLDAVGRVVITRQLPANAGTAAYQLDLSNSASGVYVLRLRNAEGVETRRLTRE